MHLAHGRPTDLQGNGYVEEVAAQHDVRCLDGNVGSCTDGLADVGLSQCGGVVHTISDHRHLATFHSSATFNYLSPGRTSAITSVMPNKDRCEVLSLHCCR